MKIPSSILLALGVAIYFDHYSPFYSAWLLLLVAAYFYFDLAQAPGRLRDRLRFLIVTLVVMMLVVIPTLVDIPVRHAAGPTYDKINDSAIQTEEAIKFLLAGKNPYVEGYANTLMAQWPLYLGLPPSQNVDLRYNPNMPLMFVLPLPFHLLGSSLFGYFDVRMYQLGVLIALYFLLFGLVADWDRKLALATVVLLNPLFTPFFIEGRNDVVPLFFFVAMIFALRRGRITWAAIMLGLGCMVKATDWFAIPFFILYLGWTRRNEMRMIVQRAFIPFAVTCAVVAVPFLVWDAGAFLSNTILFRSSLFMIWGHGLSRLVLDMGFLPDKYAPFPFAVLQVALGLLALGVLARWQRQAPTLKRTLVATTVLGFVVAYFGRAFNDNLVGFFFSQAMLAWGIEG